MAVVRSAGPDAQNGTTDDAVVEIYKRETLSRVLGYIKNDTFNTVPGITVKLTAPSAGALVTSSTVTDPDGRYEFLNVPVGDRVLQIEPKLSYVPNTAFALTAGKDEVEFVVENLNMNSTAVSSFTITYVSNPQGYYRRVRINGTVVRNSNSPRAGSGTLVPFEPVPTTFTVAGTGVMQTPIPVQISTLVSQLPDLIIGNVGSGGKLTIRLEDFDDVASGNGNAVDMTGVTFDVLFSDGSQVLFTTVKK